MRLVVIGSGYVGLVSGACFAELGHRVLCVDKDQRKIQALQAGRIPIFEPGLDKMVARNVQAGRLVYQAEAPDLADTHALFIAVGTPPGPDGRADLSAVFAAAAELAGQLKPQTVVVTKSTVPPGAGDALEGLLRAARPDLRPRVASNPEFLREGSAIEDFMAPDRIVVGANDAYGEAVMDAIYRPLTARGAPILFTGRRTAELIKYAANAFLATKISFINELADLAEAVGADATEVARGIGLDRRIGAEFLQAGPGYGGSCFPKDTAALLASAEDHATPLRVVAGAAAANAERKAGLAARVLRAAGGAVRGKRVALLGLTFKPDTDDMRDAPSLALIEGLQQAGATVRAYDPQGMAQAAGLLDRVEFAADAYACVEGADVIVLVTHWAEFRRLDVRRLASLVRARVFVDFRNAMDPEALLSADFVVHGVGRLVREPVRQPELSQPIRHALGSLNCAAE